MRAIVDGADGFVGYEVIRQLLSQNVDIVALVHNKNKREFPRGVQVIELPMECYADTKQIDLFFGGIDCFFHFGWSGTSGIQRSNEIMQIKNITYTCSAVRLAARLGCRQFINAGSIMEYEVIKFISPTEDSPGCTYFYSMAKLTADFMGKATATSLGLHYINLIISNIYGVEERSERFIYTVLTKMKHNEEIDFTHGNQPYDFIYITDAARAICLVASEGKQSGSYYIGNSKQRRLKDFIYDMKTAISSNSKLNFGAIPARKTDLDYSIFHPERLEKELGFFPAVSFRKGIKMTYKNIDAH